MCFLLFTSRVCCLRACRSSLSQYAEEEMAAFEAAEKKRREERDRIRDFEVANAAVIGLKKEEEHLAKEFEKSDDVRGLFGIFIYG